MKIIYVGRFLWRENVVYIDDTVDQEETLFHWALIKIIIANAPFIFLPEFKKFKMRSQL